jgi:hypothetical protein
MTASLTASLFLPAALRSNETHSFPKTNGFSMCRFLYRRVCAALKPKIFLQHIAMQVVPSTDRYTILMKHTSVF